MSGSALQITPGQIGELIKAQILKTNFNIPRTKTASVVLVEKVYDLIGAIIASIIGIIILELEIYLVIFASLVFLTIFFGIYPEPLFNTIDISVSNLIDNYKTDLNFYLTQTNN